MAQNKQNLATSTLIGTLRSHSDVLTPLLLHGPSTLFFASVEGKLLGCNWIIGNLIYERQASTDGVSGIIWTKSNSGRWFRRLSEAMAPR